MKTLRQITSVILFAAASQGLMALPLGYDIGTGSVVIANTADPGLVISTSLNAGLSGVAFTLDNGQSRTFAFFDIWTDESSVNKGEDTMPKAITAYLDFAIPTPNSGTTTNGTTSGVRELLGFYQNGQVTWAGPVMVTAADRSFEISLSNEEFNHGALWGLGCTGATVEATVTQRSSAIPDTSATLSLLGLGLLAIAGSRRFFCR